MKADLYSIDNFKIIRVGEFLNSKECSKFINLIPKLDITNMSPISNENDSHWAHHLNLEEKCLQDMQTKLQKLISFYFLIKNVQIVRSYILKSNPESTGDIHQDFGGLVKQISAVVFLNEVNEIKPMTFYDEQQKKIVECKNKKGDLLLFNSQVFHSQGIGLNRTTLVSNLS